MTSLFTIPRVVSSGKPIRMKNVVQHRTDRLIQEQLSVVEASQNVFRQSVLRLEALPEEQERLVERMNELVVQQRQQLNEMILIAQIAAKIKRELVHARAELKKALKTSTNIYGARKRLVWLEGQLEHLLTEKCPKVLVPIDVDTILTPTPTPPPPTPPKEPTPEPSPSPESDNRSENEKAADDMRDALERMETNMMSKEEIQDTWNKYKERREAPRSAVDYDALLNDLLDEDDSDIESEEEEDKEEEEEEGDTEKGEEEREEQEGKDIEPAVQDILQHTDEAETDPVEAQLEETPPETEDKDSNEQEELEDRLSESATAEEQTSPQAEPEMEPELERVATSDSLKEGSINVIESSASSPDLGRDYWRSEHHRFHFSEHAPALVELDPLSYHQVGLAVPGTFIQSVSKSTPSLPWRPKEAGEIHDVHRQALDKLSVRVQKMYGHVYDAAMTSVDPNHNHVQDRGHFLASSSVTKPIENKSPTQTETQAVQLPPIKSRGPQIALRFHSKPIPHAKRLPVSKLRLRQSYPRSAVELTAVERGARAQRLVNQHDLYAQTRLTLYQGKARRHSSETGIELSIAEPEPPIERGPSRSRKLGVVSRIASRFGTETPGSTLSQETHHSDGNDRPDDDVAGLKWKRMKELVNVNLRSSRAVDRADAAKQLGLMECRDVDVLAGLEECLQDSENVVRYEASKALVLLGEANESVLSSLVDYLARGNTSVRLDLIRTLISSLQNQQLDKNLTGHKSLVKVMKKLLTETAADGRVAFDAAVCLGYLCGPSEAAVTKLKAVMAGPESDLKAEALSTLVRQMHCRDQAVRDAIFSQMKGSYSWRHRADAARLLIHLGAEVVCKERAQAGAQYLTVGARSARKGGAEFEHVYGLVEERLWDEASYHVRKEVARLARSLAMVPRACERAERKLEDADEKVRAQGVITVGTLGLKKKSVVKTLLEMVELDSSEYVRRQVIKTFGLLSLREKKVIKCLRERVKNGGLLGREAAKVLAEFGESSDS